MSEIYNFKAKVTDEIYYNQDSFFGVYAFVTADNIPMEGSNLTMAGQMTRLRPEMNYHITAELVQNKKWGMQYRPISVHTVKPDDVDSAYSFLQALCTQRQARLILQNYPGFIDMVLDGVDVFDVKGVPAKTLARIVREVRETYSANDIISMLSPLGVTYKMIKKLIEGTENIEELKVKLKENPYMLTSIHGLGFKKIDGLALKMNPELRGSKKRSDAFIDYTLRMIANGEGSTLMPKSKILSEAVNYDKMEITDWSKFVEKGNLVGAHRYYTMESYIYRRITELAVQNSFTVNEEAIEIAEEKLKIKYTEEQRQAFRMVNESDFLIITGNAGTGKSTIISGLMEMFRHKKVGMCALSAKAAARIKEITGEQAHTIHKLLGWDGVMFKYSDMNRLRQDVIILDEASMVNVYMFWNLLRAIAGKFIIVFDNAQLPPIGSGNIASDLLNYGILKKVILTKIHRQAARSGIILHANQIRKGLNPNRGHRSETFGELKDMSYRFYPKEELQVKLIGMFMSAVQKYGVEKTTIIVPRKAVVPLSTKEINHIIHRKLFDEDVPTIHYGHKTFALGAKVIQKVNDYDNMVFNGEIGFIIDVDPLKVQFADRVIPFEREALKSIELAYAITVHSFQGSQADIIIIGLDFSHYILLDNCLLYTAITRASKHCLIVAEGKAFDHAVRANKGKKRTTFLSLLISGKIQPEEEEDE